MNSLVPSIYAFTRRNKDKIILTKIIEDYLRETQEEIEILKANNCQVITEFESCLNQFTSLVKLAFDNDSEKSSDSREDLVNFYNGKNRLKGQFDYIKTL